MLFEGGGNIIITETHVAALFRDCQAATKKVLTDELKERTGCGKTADYNALQLDGRFKEHLIETDKLLNWLD